MDKMYDVPKKKNKTLDPKFGVKPVALPKKTTSRKPSVVKSGVKKPTRKSKKDITKIPGFKFGRGTE